MSKSTRKLRIHYVVGNDLDLWWSSKARAWVPYSDEIKKFGLSNHRGFRTKRRALGHGIYMGFGFYVVQYNPHCGWRRKLGRGTWLTQEWVMTKPGRGKEIQRAEERRVRNLIEGEIRPLPLDTAALYAKHHPPSEMIYDPKL